MNAVDDRATAAPGDQDQDPAPALPATTAAEAEQMPFAVPAVRSAVLERVRMLRCTTLIEP